MSILKRILQTIKGTVRYKLLVLVLLPILLVMPIALAMAVYWGSRFSYEQLFIKVNTDLSVAHDIFGRIREDYLNQLTSLAESYNFQIALKQENKTAIQQQITRLKNTSGFNYLHLVDPAGNWMFEGRQNNQARNSSSFLSALEGQAIVGVEIFTPEELAAEETTMARLVELELLETPRARPTERTTENRGMMIRTIVPISNDRGKVIALLDGGVLLNNNFEFVDTIRDLVYGPGSLPEGSIGTVTVFLDDVRISTNVPLRLRERALGTRVSNEVRTKVLDHGETWIDRAFVVNDWYISAYEPIIDINGQRVGILYAGFLEKPFRNELWRALFVLIFMFIALMVIYTLVAIRGAKSIFKPIEVMSNIVSATRAGDKSQRIGNIKSTDELGVLAKEFDAMLELLQQRQLQLQTWAEQLEEKVTERTTELQQKNTDLKHTINALQQTRQQLVVAEKLAALGELTAGVAHEINNPTQVILGNLDVLSESLGKNVKPVEDEIELIIQQVYRIQEIVNHLLQYAHPDQYASYVEEIDINIILQDTLKLVRHLQTKHRVDISLQPNATQHVEINPQELEQVLVNLITNAIHALPEVGGKIKIISRNWEDKGVAISIEDNGCGIDEDQIGKIFNPFYSTKGQGKGTGLGLSVSYGIIRRYGGNITVTSAPGKGSDFCIWLLTEPAYIEDEKMLREQLQSIESNR